MGSRGAGSGREGSGSGYRTPAQKNLTRLYLDAYEANSLNSEEADRLDRGIDRFISENGEDSETFEMLNQAKQDAVKIAEKKYGKQWRNLTPFVLD